MWSPYKGTSLLTGTENGNCCFVNIMVAVITRAIVSCWEMGGKLDFWYKQVNYLFFGCEAPHPVIFQYQIKLGYLFLSSIYSITIGLLLSESRSNRWWLGLKTHCILQQLTCWLDSSSHKQMTIKQLLFVKLHKSYMTVTRRQCSVLCAPGESDRLRKGESWRVWHRRGDAWVMSSHR